MIYRYKTADINLDDISHPVRYKKHNLYFIRMDYSDGRNPNILTFFNEEERDSEYIHICELIFSLESKDA